MATRQIKQEQGKEGTYVMKKLNALFVAMTLVGGAANLAMASDTHKPADHKEKKDEKKKH